MSAPTVSGPTADAPVAATGSRPRVVALDAVRGLAIVVLLTAMHPGPRDAFPHQYHHPEWHGLSFIDLFFPVFLFAVGASIPFSSRGERAGAVAWRAAKLALVGVALVSVSHQELRFAGVLQHIAIAYLVGWLVLRLPRGGQVAAVVALVVGYWAGFLLAAGPGVDPWSMSGGFAHDVNSWFFGNFRTEGVPQSVVSAVNVVVGAWCGQLVRRHRDPRELVQRTALLAAGLVLAALAVRTSVPFNKKLWSPSYTLFTAGASVFFFALFAWALEIRRWRAWAQPLVELGSNAIGVYIAVNLALATIPEVRGPIDRALDGLASPAVITWAWALAWLLVGWLACRALYRRRLFLKI